MTDMKTSLDDIFNDDLFINLKSEQKKTTSVKTDEDRLIEEFEEINIFVDSHNREPSSSSMSEFGLLAKLKKIRNDENKKKTLKPYDRHDLLGHVDLDIPTLEDIFNDDSGILESDNDYDIFTYKHIPKESERAETDYIAKRKPMNEKEFAPYKRMFQEVHQDLKNGKRSIKEFKNVDTQLKPKNFYLIDGVMIYLESVDLSRDIENLSINMVNRKDGRTRTIFENGTVSNMLYRSVSKAIYNGGRKMISTVDNNQVELFVEPYQIDSEDISTGWIYVLKSKSDHPDIVDLSNLHKIGFTKTPIENRIKNAKNEATYLFSDVKVLAKYQVINVNADKLEKLLHNVFSEACLDIEFTTEKGQRINPREWFVVPFEAIEEAINLILNGNILDYEYDTDTQNLRIKTQ